MRITLDDIRRKLAEGAYKNEEHVRLSLVSRILLELEWDLWNPSEVNSEFVAVPNEDSTRVDLALFVGPYAPPSVYIEIKGVGRLQGDISQFEIQLRDYNRNNTAVFSIITDGRRWRFYYSQTGGEFAKKCFKSLDLVSDDVEELESVFRAFLSKSEIKNGSSRQTAEKYLQLSQKQRAMEDVLPHARRMLLEPDYPSLPQALVQQAAKIGISVTEEEAARFIKEFTTQKPMIDVPASISVTTPSSKVSQIRPDYGSQSPKEKARLLRRQLISELQRQGINLAPVKGVIHKTEQGRVVGIAVATEQANRAESWFLGLPAQEYDAIVFLCEQANRDVVRFVFPREFLLKHKDNFSQSAGQFKFHISAEDKAYYMKIPSVSPIEINQYLNNFAPLKTLSR